MMKAGTAQVQFGDDLSVDSGDGLGSAQLPLGIGNLAPFGFQRMRSNTTCSGKDDEKGRSFGSIEELKDGNLLCLAIDDNQGVSHSCFPFKIGLINSLPRIESVFSSED